MQGVLPEESESSMLEIYKKSSALKAYPDSRNTKHWKARC